MGADPMAAAVSVLTIGLLFLATPAATASVPSTGAQDGDRSDQEQAASHIHSALVASATDLAEPNNNRLNGRAGAAGQRRSGFRFGTPRGYFGIKGGWSVARANSDIFDFNSDNLTLENSDFNAPLFGADLAWTINPRVDALFGVEYSKTSPRSEFRDFVDEFGAPIVQETSLQQAPLTASLRFNLTERGRAVGNYAWIPASAVPYVGVGGGFTWWRYEQFGDFVDFVDFTIFTDHFASDGWAPTAQVFGGLDVSLSPRIGLALEGRYVWASAELAPAFVGFEPLDLTGFRGSLGVNFRF